MFQFRDRNGAIANLHPSTFPRALASNSWQEIINFLLSLGDQGFRMRPLLELEDGDEITSIVLTVHQGRLWFDRDPARQVGRENVLRHLRPQRYDYIFGEGSNSWPLEIYLTDHRTPL